MKVGFDMENDFKPLYSFITGQFTNTYIDPERKLMLHKPFRLPNENK